MHVDFKIGKLLRKVSASFFKKDIELTFTYNNFKFNGRNEEKQAVRELL